MHGESLRTNLWANFVNLLGLAPSWEFSSPPEGGRGKPSFLSYASSLSLSLLPLSSQKFVTSLQNRAVVPHGMTSNKFQLPCAALAKGEHTDLM